MRDQEDDEMDESSEDVMRKLKSIIRMPNKGDGSNDHFEGLRRWLPERKEE